jgi:hypothetical protein
VRQIHLSPGGETFGDLLGYFKEGERTERTPLRPTLTEI